MSVTVTPIDPNETDTRGVDFAPALPTNDTTLASVAVSILSGTCTISANLAGPYAATATASVTDTTAIVAITGAEAPGPLCLVFRATTSGGRILDETVVVPVTTH